MEKQRKRDEDKRKRGKKSVSGKRGRPVSPLSPSLRSGQATRVADTQIPLHMPDNALEITPDLRIPLTELDYQASRSGGPGGQHVNTSSTRIEVWWDVARSPTLSAEQRAQLLERLRPRLDSTGRLRLVSSASRSQLRNREDVTERLRSVVASALAVRKKRKPTRPSRASKAARLEAKRRRAMTKERRRAPGRSDE
jgi:ribosome-associated protein